MDLCIPPYFSTVLSVQKFTLTYSSASQLTYSFSIDDVVKMSSLVPIGTTVFNALNFDIDLPTVLFMFTTPAWTLNFIDVTIMTLDPANPT